MRADCFDEPQRLPGDVGVEVQATLVCVLQIIQMPFNRELNVAGRDDVAGQDGGAVVADAVGMVSGADAGM